MANISVVDAKYNPFSYEEILKPLEYLRNRQDVAEEKLEATQEKAAPIEAYLQNPADADSLARYQQYMSTLQDAADRLGSRGANDPGVRSQLLQARTQYAKEIAPLQTAYTLRAAELDTLRKAKTADATLEFDRDPSQTPLTAYLDGSAPQVRTISMDKVYNMAAADFATDAEKLRKIGEYINLGHGTFTNERLNQFGFTPEEIEAVRTGSQKEYLAKKRADWQQYFKSQAQWGDQTNSKIDQAIDLAMWKSLGQKQPEDLGDQQAAADYQNSLQQTAAGPNNTNLYTPPNPIDYSYIIGTDMDGRTSKDIIDDTWRDTSLKEIAEKGKLNLVISTSPSGTNNNTNSQFGGVYSTGQQIPFSLNPFNKDGTFASYKSLIQQIPKNDPYRKLKEQAVYTWYVSTAGNSKSLSILGLSRHKYKMANGEWNTVLQNSKGHQLTQRDLLSDITNVDLKNNPWALKIIQTKSNDLTTDAGTKSFATAYLDPNYSELHPLREYNKKEGLTFDKGHALTFNDLIDRKTSQVKKTLGNIAYSPAYPNYILLQYDNKWYGMPISKLSSAKSDSLKNYAKSAQQLESLYQKHPKDQKIYSAYMAVLNNIQTTLANLFGGGLKNDPYQTHTDSETKK